MQEHTADDGMQLASVRNGNSYVQTASHATPDTAYGDKKLHGRNGDESHLAVDSISAITDFVGVTRI